MRVKALDVGPKLLGSLFEGTGHIEWTKVHSDWPADARIINVFWMPQQHMIRFLVESKTFPETPELSMYSNMSVTFSREVLSTDDLVSIMTQTETIG